MNDTISRQAAIDEFDGVKVEEVDCTDFDTGFNDGIDFAISRLSVMPSAKSDSQWIPCSERLPEEDKDVLISYRYKEGEGDTSYSRIDITSYGQMYFGGNRIGDNKHWRAPFEYFESNYKVIAWMPLPEPYTEGNKV